MDQFLHFLLYVWNFLTESFFFLLVKLLQLMAYMLLWDRRPFRAGVLLVETHVMDFGKGSYAKIQI